MQKHDWTLYNNEKIKNDNRHHTFIKTICIDFKINQFEWR